MPAPIAFDTGLMVPMAGVPWASAAPTSHLVLLTDQHRRKTRRPPGRRANAPAQRFAPSSVSAANSLPESSTAPAPMTPPQEIAPAHDTDRADSRAARRWLPHPSASYSLPRSYQLFPAIRGGRFTLCASSEPPHSPTSPASRRRVEPVPVRPPGKSATVAR